MPPLATRKHLWSVYNSVQTRTSYVKKGRTLFWRDAFNALGMFDANHPVETGTPRAAFNKFGWDEGDVEVRGLATNDPYYPDNYPDHSVVTEGFKKIDSPFDFQDFEVDADLVLGGWDGHLVKSTHLLCLKCPRLRLTRACVKVYYIPAGLSPGAHDRKTLGIDVSNEVALPEL